MESPPSTPTKLGRYDVLSKIAAGGAATVYLGRMVGKAGFERAVAIKVLHEHHSTDASFVAAFLDEARLSARINHPNVVAVHDVDTSDQRLFLVMDFVEGASLSWLNRKLNARGLTLPVEVTVRAVHDSLLGLHAAHELRNSRDELLGLIHRDVSPQNVLLSTNGIVRITDFGVAKATGRIMDTVGKAFKGKFRYMAPEQARSNPCDRRVDVFAMGVVLWESLTGEALFEGNTPAEILAAVLSAPIHRPAKVNDRAPVALDGVCMKALERDPEVRYRTAADFAEALAEAYGTALMAPRKLGAFVEELALVPIQRSRNILSRTSSAPFSSMPPSDEDGGELIDSSGGQIDSGAAAVSDMLAELASSPSNPAPPSAPPKPAIPRLEARPKPLLPPRAKRPGRPVKPAPLQDAEPLSPQTEELLQEYILASEEEVDSKASSSEPESDSAADRQDAAPPTDGEVAASTDDEDVAADDDEASSEQEDEADDGSDIDSAGDVAASTDDEDVAADEDEASSEPEDVADDLPDIDSGPAESDAEQVAVEEDGAEQEQGDVVEGSDAEVPEPPLLELEQLEQADQMSEAPVGPPARRIPTWAIAGAAIVLLGSGGLLAWQQTQSSQPAPLPSSAPSGVEAAGPAAADQSKGRNIPAHDTGPAPSTSVTEPSTSATASESTTPTSSTAPSTTRPFSRYSTKTRTTRKPPKTKSSAKPIYMPPDL